ncbi:hypothetical protein C4K02_0680 [Pseudomonas synxantha]|nr:hypothetical protein C4K02_0680 [Pseudomonas synxantha]
MKTDRPAPTGETDREAPLWQGQRYRTVKVTSTVGASLLAKVVNDNAGVQAARGVLAFFASKLAPTG